MFNKRGQELSTGTIILLIIGVIILVLLALGFTSGWSKLFPWITQGNVDHVRSTCSSVCTSGGVDDYCVVQRDLIPSDKSEKIMDATCYYLVSKEPQYEIEGCGIDCSNRVRIVEGINDRIALANSCTADEKTKGIILQAKIPEASSFVLASVTCSN
jgi:hypothetical protein